MPEQTAFELHVSTLLILQKQPCKKATPTNLLFSLFFYHKNIHRVQKSKKKTLGGPNKCCLKNR